MSYFLEACYSLKTAMPGNLKFFFFFFLKYTNNDHSSLVDFFVPLTKLIFSVYGEMS